MLSFSVYKPEYHRVLNCYKTMTYTIITKAQRFWVDNLYCIVIFSRILTETNNTFRPIMYGIIKRDGKSNTRNISKQ